MKILKFGGSSLASPTTIRKVAAIVLNSCRTDQKIAVVVSAFQGVTDGLIEAARQAALGNNSYQQLANQIAKRHFNAVQELVPPKDQTTILTSLKLLVNDLEDVLHGVYLVKELSPRTRDFIVSFGERFSAQIVNASLKTMGINCQYLDAREIIKTNSDFGNALVDFPSSNTKIQQYFESNSTIQIVTGFVASTEQNETTTLGRGGSDYTAAILAAALNVAEIEIWTDVDGVMTADPRKVSKAFPLLRLTYEEALELCHFGAKVIYPPTMQPALEKGIAIRIRNSFNPDFPGTVIEKRTTAAENIVTGISSIDSIALLRVQGSGMVGVVGISQRLFSALSRSSINVILITQASSEHTICVAVSPDQAERARQAVENEFKLEINALLVSKVIVERNLSIVSAVGVNMSHRPGIAGRLFQALGRNGINVVAIAQGSSELNISLVVSDEDQVKALNAIHDEFFLGGSRSLNLFIVGSGLIAGTLVEQIKLQHESLREDLSLDLKLIGITNTRHQLINKSGIAIERCLDLLNCAPAGNITSFVDRMIAANLPNSILIDCTASTAVTDLYAKVLKANISIVTPNKKALSASYHEYQQLQQIARYSGAFFLYETSVGAGLPVLSTLRDLRRSGDRVINIEACLSGTLSYIFNSFDGTKPFSAVVAEAKDRGYTEPDPRDDLAGSDVGRKILILAREVGLALEPDQISVESLIPEQCKYCQSVTEFMQALPVADSQFERRRSEAAQTNHKLVYLAQLRDGIAQVRLEKVGIDHPFHSLSGSDNIISFTTERYFERPLVVKGPGAGAAVTAAGVFADIIRIGNQR